MKTPFFWYEDSPGARLAAAALTPLSWIYRLADRLNRAKIQPRKISVPVVCVGNLVAGGSGKTPVALALMKLILEQGFAARPHFLTRGYGGSLAGPVLADAQAHSFRETGDEPLLLSRAAPTVISVNRAAGTRFAIENEADFIVMDDGLQNRQIKKTLAFAVIDGESGFGNGRVLPAGPLREPLTAGFALADAFIIIGEDTRNAAALLPSGKPVFAASLKITDSAAAMNSSQPYIGFCGLGRPSKFRATLESRGCNLAGWRSYPDHYAYTQNDLDKLDAEAAEKSARLITTEKDAVRLSGLKIKTPVDVLPVEITWQDKASLLKFLQDSLKGAA